MEHAHVHGNYYGTLKSEVKQKWQNEKDIILDIDYQGAQQITKQLPKNELLKIFIVPPSLEILKQRLINRGENSIEEIEKRIHNAENEMKHQNEYNFVVVNDILDKTVKQIENIIAQRRIENAQKQLIPSGFYEKY